MIQLPIPSKKFSVSTWAGEFFELASWVAASAVLSAASTTLLATSTAVLATSFPAWKTLSPILSNVFPRSSQKFSVSTCASEFPAIASIAFYVYFWGCVTTSAVVFTTSTVVSATSSAACTTQSPILPKKFSVSTWARPVVSATAPATSNPFSRSSQKFSVST